MSPDLEGRLARTRELTAAQEAEAFLVSSPENVRYLSGFTGEGLLVVTPNRLLLSTDSRYQLEAAELPAAIEVTCDSRGHLAGCIGFLNDLSPATVLFEAEATRYASYQELERKLTAELKAVSRLVEGLRVFKDEAEVAAIREAARRTDAALEAFLGALQPGQAERKLALQLHLAMAEQETEPAFPIIMASGPSSARPHAVPGSRDLQPGEMLKIDVGGRFGGYCSDITRTVFVGEPTEQFRTVYNLVREAQQTALEAVRPGLTGREVDAIARQIITEGGYGPEFGHGLGHGVGLEVHERPRVSSQSEDVLGPGMVITIEPGIYLEGWGGVRIEDTVLVTAMGHEVLTAAPKAEY